MKITAKRNREIAGWIILKPLKHNGHTEIEYLYVTKKFRRSGIASQLIERAKKENSTLVAFIEPHPESSLTYTEQVA